jgi:DNA-binding NtrC family response regulator
MSKRFLLVRGSPDMTWGNILSEALRTLGQLDFTSEELAIQEELDDYALIIIEAGGITDVAMIVTSVHQRRPALPIVVVTSSPTWQRARRVFLAGAADYIRKSLDPDTLLRTFQEVITRLTRD